MQIWRQVLDKLTPVLIRQWKLGACQEVRVSVVAILGDKMIFFLLQTDKDINLCGVVVIILTQLASFERIHKQRRTGDVAALVFEDCVMEFLGEFRQNRLNATKWRKIKCIAHYQRRMYERKSRLPEELIPITLC
ncbi:hypothetical protein CAOG_009869 [Capsaspora owczarzaki ATCC 30864]|uniref:Uncharacterized protein n=1 Tax=Capsaspora owczarzaki (strain ATCC 30864) TaxID=595528 RepID=A0A0D2WTP2_CAPO3|nr:hypothetical protein CAOG_009869 [Capsaspora owczarzaki ATCC 30864]